MQAETKTSDPVNALLCASFREMSEGGTCQLNEWPMLNRAASIIRPGTLSVIGGDPGCAKSFFALALGLACERACLPWLYLPLECDKSFHGRRLAAILDGSWDALADPGKQVDAVDRLRCAVERTRERLVTLLPNICENPARVKMDGARLEVTPDAVLDLCRTQFGGGRKVIFVDPMAGIDFSGDREQWKAENRFIKSIRDLCDDTGGCVTLIVHTAKRSGAAHNQRPGMADLQGGAALSRFADSILILQAHEPVDREVIRHGCGRGMEESNRTLVIAKSRNGEGGNPVAFDFGHSGPRFREVGAILPKRFKQGDAF